MSYLVMNGRDFLVVVEGVPFHDEFVFAVFVCSFFWLETSVPDSMSNRDVDSFIKKYFVLLAVYVDTSLT